MNLIERQVLHCLLKQTIIQIPNNIEVGSRLTCVSVRRLTRDFSERKLVWDKSKDEILVTNPDTTLINGFECQEHICHLFNDGQD